MILIITMTVACKANMCGYVVMVIMGLRGGGKGQKGQLHHPSPHPPPPLGSYAYRHKASVTIN